MQYLDGLVPGSGDDLPVVGRESNRKHILGVVLKPAGGLRKGNSGFFFNLHLFYSMKMLFGPAGGLAGGKVPQPEGLVPGAGQGKVSIRGKNLNHELSVINSLKGN